MGSRLQAVNHDNQMILWMNRVEACRSSGLSVAQWCKENGISTSTYFSWQRRVFKLVASEEQPCFAEVPLSSDVSQESNVAAVIRQGPFTVELYNGVDVTTIRAILQAIQSC